MEVDWEFLPLAVLDKERSETVSCQQSDIIEKGNILLVIADATGVRQEMAVALSVVISALAWGEHTVE